ncbi:MAG TPA: helix-turn-helix domain-containing protein [Solirubrobacterales bacterium]|nr:helix-turn-helix domain-containing protein [Solirubrobacterales bacterium]
MGRALSHPLRVRILMTMNAPIRKLSPSDFCEEAGCSMGLASYHFRELQKAGCIEVAETVQRRGATEHLYLPVKRAMAWSREWEMLGSVVKQNLAATALSGAVEVIGEAVDQGTFEGLPDSVLAWDVMRVDMPGWEKAHDILARAITELIEVGDECRERVADLPPEKVFLVSYLMSSFESPERPESE